MTTHHLDIVYYPVSSLVRIVADLIESIIETNDKLILSSNTANSVTYFHSRTVPTISIYNYLMRILRFTPFSNEVLLSLLIYFDRIAKRRNIKYSINSLTAHRFLITSIVIASKFTSDIYCPNSRYAKVGGISLGELNKLELEFLFLCNFNLHVKLEDMQAYGNQLLTHAVSQLHSANYNISTPATPSLKRKRTEDSTEIKTKIIKRSEVLLDKALISTTTIKTATSLLRNRIIFPSHTAITTSYTPMK